MTGAGDLDAELRQRLAELADRMIPPGDGMPAPSSLDIAGRQLDAVLTSLPAVAPALRRALSAAVAGDPIPWLGDLHATDPEAHDALALAVVAGYYLHPEVTRLLGYPGQLGQQISAEGFPDYAADGLLERVYERGPIYRPTPPG